MSRNSASTRRSFLKAGALIAAPLATTIPASVLAADRDLGDPSLVDEAAIRRLHQDWLRAMNAGVLAPRRSGLYGDVRSIVGDPSGEPDLIRVAADGTRAIGRFACTVETVTELPLDSTFAQMAHAQGGGSARTSRRGVLSAEYAKSANVWAIAGVTFDPI
jgi:hypothetical protein